MISRGLPMMLRYMRTIKISNSVEYSAEIYWEVNAILISVRNKMVKKNLFLKSVRNMIKFLI